MVGHMIITPLSNFHLVLRDDTPEKTEGGIILTPTATQEKPNQGVVVRSASDLEPFELEGKRVIFSKKALREGVIEKDGKEYVLVNHTHLLAIIEEG